MNTKDLVIDFHLLGKLKGSTEFPWVEKHRTIPFGDQR